MLSEVDTHTYADCLQARCCITKFTTLILGLPCSGGRIRGKALYHFSCEHDLIERGQNFQNRKATFCTYGSFNSILGVYIGVIQCICSFCCSCAIFFFSCEKNTRLFPPHLCNLRIVHVDVHIPEWGSLGMRLWIYAMGRANPRFVKYLLHLRSMDKFRSLVPRLPHSGTRTFEGVQVSRAWYFLAWALSEVQHVERS